MNERGGNTVEDAKYQPKLLLHTKMRCPICGYENAFMEVYEHEIPVIDRINIVVFKCEKCGLRIRDTIPYYVPGKRTIIRVFIERPEDLNTLIYRSPSALVKIEDLGIELEPIGEGGEDSITTAEGLIATIAGMLEFYCEEGGLDPEARSECSKKLVMLKEVLSLRRTTTILIDDPEGLSVVLKTYREGNYSMEVHQ